MKKVIALLMVAALSVSTLVGCGSQSATSSAAPASQASQAAASSEAASSAAAATAGADTGFRCGAPFHRSHGRTRWPALQAAHRRSGVRRRHSVWPAQ